MRPAALLVAGVVVGCIVPPLDPYACRSDVDCLGVPGGSCDTERGQCRWAGHDPGTSSSSGSLSSTSSGGTSENPGSSGGTAGTGSSRAGGSSRPANHAPVLEDLDLVTTPGGSVNGHVDNHDPDGDTVTIAVAVQPTQGSVTLSGTRGDFTYAARTDAAGEDVFVVSGSDDFGGVALARVSVRMPAPFSASRTWVGGAVTGPRDWATAANWSPSGAPTSTDQVLVPGAVSPTPVLSVDAAVAGILVEAGAQLDLGAHSLTAQDVFAPGLIQAVTGSVRLTAGVARVSGNVPALVVGTGAALVGATRVARGVTVDSGGVLDVNLRALVVDGALATVNTGVLRMQHAAGRVTVGGDASFSGGNTQGLLTAGTLEVRGNLASAWSSFLASGFHLTVMHGTGNYAITMAGAHRFMNLEVLSPVQLAAAIVVGGDLLVSAPVALSGAVQTGADVTGRLVTVPGSSVTVPVLTLRDPSGTTLVGGTLRAARLVVAAADARLAPMGYQAVEVTGSAALPDGTTLSGDLVVSGPGVATIAGLVDVQGVTVTDSAQLVMSSDLADLRAHRAVSFAGGSSHLSGGLLELLGGDLVVAYNALGASQTHVTRLASDTARPTVRFSNTSASAQLNHVEVTGSAGAFFASSARIAGQLRIPVGAACSAGPGTRIVVAGDVVTAAASTLGAAELSLGGTGGTSTIAGTLDAEVVELAGTAQPLVSSRTYRSIRVTGTHADIQDGVGLTQDFEVSGTGASATLASDLTVPGTLSIHGGGAILHLGGRTVVAGTLSVYDSGVFEMRTGDAATIQSSASFQGTSTLTGGSLTVGGAFQAAYNGFVASSSHRTLLAGTNAVVTMNGQGLTCRFQDLEVAAGKSADVDGHAVVAATLTVRGTLRVPTGKTLTAPTVWVEQGGSLEIDGTAVFTDCTIRDGGSVTGARADAGCR